jgi:hypothetical protein
MKKETAMARMSNSSHQVGAANHLRDRLYHLYMLARAPIDI